MGSAADLGRRLLREVESVGLDEILHLLRLEDETKETHHFGLPPLDRLIHTATDARQTTPKTKRNPPIVELMSLAPGGGKTHLLYHLCAQAVLPKALSGQQSCVIILDTDGRFSVPRLAAQLQLLVHQRSSTPNSNSDSSTGQPPSEAEVETIISTALKHVHIFRPQTLASTVATLNALPAHLFDPGRHFSFDRAVAFLALDSASAFYWQDRAEVEDAVFLAATNPTPVTGDGERDRLPPSPQSAYAALATALKTASRTFNCPVVVTTWYLGPGPVTSQQQQQQQQRFLRSSLPPAFAALPLLRLVVQRVPVRKFPAGYGVVDAVREAEDRRKAVEEGKFECAAIGNEWGVEIREGVRGDGFGFRILGEGLCVVDG